MKKLLSIIVLFAVVISVNAQKVEEIEIPMSKKARKFGQYGGSFFTADKNAIWTFYTYRESKNQPRVYDEITTTLDGKTSEPKTNDLTLENLVQYNLSIDETISEEAEFENFNQPMVWFKRMDLSTNAVAFGGYFVPVDDGLGFMGYNFEKSSDKTLLMGKEDVSLNMDFVLAEGPIVEKYSSKVLNRKGLFNVTQLATFGFAPKGGKVLIGGIMNGRVKIGMNASPDWIRNRYMTGIYNTENMSWESQQFFEFDYTLSNLRSIKKSDEAAVLLRKDSKGTIKNNRVRFNDCVYKGLMVLIFDSKGNLKSQVDLPYEDLDLQESAVGEYVPNVYLNEVDGDYVATTVAFDGKDFKSLTLYRISDGKLIQTNSLKPSDFENASKPSGEKIKSLFPKNTLIEIREIISLDGETMFLGSINKDYEFIITTNGNDQTASVVVSQALDKIKSINIPLGKRTWTGLNSWSKEKSTDDADALQDVPAIVQKDGDYTYILYRKNQDWMTPGSRISRSYSGYNSITTTTITVDELFTFGKLLVINNKTGEVTSPISFDDKILVGENPFLIGNNGRVFFHGWDGKKYMFYSFKM
jgi:hypothetical protein